MRSLLLTTAMICGAVSMGAQTTVPFVGCASDGQVGPLEAPKGPPKHVNLPPEIAARLAYYKAENGEGVLAPRGWRCFSTYGSNGATLFVTPVPIDTEHMFKDPHVQFHGPAIELSTSIGDTSGRFEVADIIARLFPAHRDFAVRVLNEHLGLERLPTGPSPADRLKYLSKESVEYTTPAGVDGEGTHSFLVKNDRPIEGVVMLSGEELSATHLAVRMRAEDAGLAPYITRQVERDGAGTGR